jgi:hypothetical protein
MKVPFNFREDSTFRGAHGGSRWVGPDAEVGLDIGWWSVQYPSGRALACRFTGAHRSYTVKVSASVSGYHVFATPTDIAGGSSTAIWGRSSTVEGLATIWTLIMMSSR